MLKIFLLRLDVEVGDLFIKILVCLSVGVSLLFSRSLLCKVRLNIKKCLSVCLSVCPKTICLMIMLHHSLYSQYSFRKPYLYKTWHILNDLYIFFIFLNIELYILRIYTFLYFRNFYIYKSYE